MTQPLIPLVQLRISAAQEQLVLDVLRSGHLAQGVQVKRFEVAFAARHDVAHAVAVCSGTAALIAALEVLDLQPGDEVITTPFTFAATLDAIVECGATARFADIGEDFNIRADAVEALVNDRTRAILPVHLFGAPADMCSLATVADRHGAAIVEDAAQAVGARHRGRSVGSFGTGCFSFYATKNITTGEGGMVTTGDAVTADRLRVLRNQGMRDAVPQGRGHNYRMTDVAAAIGLPQLAGLDAINAARAANADRLRAGLDGVAGVVLPPESPPQDLHAHHQFTVRITGTGAVDRDGFLDALTRLGIGCRAFYPRLTHDAPHYRGHPQVVPDHTPDAATAAVQVASIPVHQHLDTADVDRIIGAVRDVLGG